jgi:hypothetical protein
MSETGSAWYYHFWPWFIVALLGSAVAASLATVVIAYRHADVEVSRSSSSLPPLRKGLPDPPSRGVVTPGEEPDAP